MFTKEQPYKDVTREITKAINGCISFEGATLKRIQREYQEKIRTLTELSNAVARINDPVLLALLREYERISIAMDDIVAKYYDEEDTLRQEFLARHDSQLPQGWGMALTYYTELPEYKNLEQEQRQCQIDTRGYLRRHGIPGDIAGFMLTVAGHYTHDNHRDLDELLSNAEKVAQEITKNLVTQEGGNHEHTTT